MICHSYVLSLTLRGSLRENCSVALAFAIEVLLYHVSIADHCNQFLAAVATLFAAGGMTMSLIAVEMAIRPPDSLLALRIYSDKQLVADVSEVASSIPHWLRKNSYFSEQCHASKNFSALQHSNSRRHTDFETTLTSVDYLSLLGLDYLVWLVTVIKSDQSIGQKSRNC